MIPPGIGGVACCCGEDPWRLVIDCCTKEVVGQTLESYWCPYPVCGYWGQDCFFGGTGFFSACCGTLDAETEYDPMLPVLTGTFGVQSCDACCALPERYWKFCLCECDGPTGKPPPCYWIPEAALAEFLPPPYDSGNAVKIAGEPGCFIGTGESLFLDEIPPGDAILSPGDLLDMNEIPTESCTTYYGYCCEPPGPTCPDCGATAAIVAVQYVPISQTCIDGCGDSFCPLPIGTVFPILPPEPPCDEQDCIDYCNGNCGIVSDALGCDCCHRAILTCLEIDSTTIVWRLAWAVNPSAGCSLNLPNGGCDVCIKSLGEFLGVFQDCDDPCGGLQGSFLYSAVFQTGPLPNGTCPQGQTFNVVSSFNVVATTASVI